MTTDSGIWGWSYKFQNTFLKSRKIFRISLIFKSTLFHAIAGDGKKEFIKCLALKREMLLLVLVLHALLTLGSILKRYSGD